MNKCEFKSKFSKLFFFFFFPTSTFEGDPSRQALSLAAVHLLCAQLENTKTKPAMGIEHQENSRDNYGLLLQPLCLGL